MRMMQNDFKYYFAIHTQCDGKKEETFNQFSIAGIEHLLLELIVV